MRNCNDDYDDDGKMHGDDISCMGTEDGDDNNSMLELNSIDAGASYPTSVTANVSVKVFFFSILHLV